MIPKMMSSSYDRGDGDHGYDYDYAVNNNNNNNNNNRLVFMRVNVMT